MEFILHLIQPGNELAVYRLRLPVAPLVKVVARQQVENQKFCIGIDAAPPGIEIAFQGQAFMIAGFIAPAAQQIVGDEIFAHQ